MHVAHDSMIVIRMPPRWLGPGSVAIGAVAKIECPADSERDKMLLIGGFRVLEQFDCTVFPLDGDREVTGIGNGGGERVDAVCIVPASQLTGEGCLFHGSPGVVKSRIFAGRRAQASPWCPRAWVGFRWMSVSYSRTTLVVALFRFQIRAR